MNSEKPVTRGLMLDVPFSEKDEAKRLGARWDPDMRKWFVPRGLDSRKFAKWDPSAKAGQSDLVQKTTTTAGYN